MKLQVTSIDSHEEVSVRYINHDGTIQQWIEEYNEDGGESTIDDWDLRDGKLWVHHNDHLDVTTIVQQV